MNSPDEQASALFAAAQRDWRTFLILMRDPESPLETTLFHAQQTMEKGLKSALVLAGIVFPRTHDLLELSEIATAHGLCLPVARDLIVRLGPYAVEFRYLGVIAPDVGLGEARDAILVLMDYLSAETITNRGVQTE